MKREDILRIVTEDPSMECNFCKHLDDISGKVCARCSHNFTNRFEMVATDDEHTTEEWLMVLQEFRRYACRYERVILTEIIEYFERKEVEEDANK